LQPAYERRWRAMMGAIEKYLLPLGAELPRQKRDVVGGYFIWLTLPVNAVKLAKRAKEKENLIVAEGAIFEVPGDREVANFPNNIRLCFAWEDEERLSEGIERLGRVLKGMLGEADGGGDGDVDESRESELHRAF
jgi:DNA-binding transcriptional MocR family regulator